MKNENCAVFLPTNLFDTYPCDYCIVLIMPLDHITFDMELHGRCIPAFIRYFFSDIAEQHLILIVICFIEVAAVPNVCFMWDP